MAWISGYNYREGGIVDVRQTAGTLADRCAVVLGLSSPTSKINLYSPGFLYKLLNRDAINYAASYQPAKRRIITAKKQHEAVLFHELVHYLMDSNELLIARTPSTNPVHYFFYTRLVDETAAETATVSEYGYADELIKGAINPDYDAAQRMLDFFSRAPAKIIREMELSTGMSASEIYTEARITEAERLHRETETEFRRSGLLPTKEVNELIEILDKLPYDGMTTLVRNIAVGNSVKMSSSGISPPATVSAIKNFRQKQDHEIYFYVIAPLL